MGSTMSDCKMYLAGGCCGTRKEKGPSRFQLSPSPIGGAKRDRTADLYNAIVALSQLSYGPEFCGRMGPPGLAADLIGLPGRWCKRKIPAPA
jgi:hypothetical protein